ncbi:hypothetical protein JOC36_000869 [Weissella uvarum]|uniref:DUF956 family protein n=1 Tax=Weissella uvarum TaxID=1479233 RepID=UPI00196201B8|nr:DUF956 family protein [Weissella uvarum]MBM7617320.1 hypothetical protein [Weissella uvarum]MCM0595187.1 DUF956 family protein [Weissella uvarum]
MVKQDKAQQIDNVPELSARANASLSALNIQPGYLFYGDKAIEFRSNKGGYIIIPWEQIDYVSLEIILKVYYRGLIIKTKEDQTFEFVGGKPRQALEIMKKHLQPNQLRRRLGAWERHKMKK